MSSELRELVTRAESSGAMLVDREDRKVYRLEDWVVKVYFDRKGLRGWLDRFLGYRAYRAERASRLLMARGIGVVGVSGVVRYPRGIAVIMPFQPGAQLRDLCQGSHSQRLGLVHTVAAFVRTLHARRIYPGDFHQGNFLIDGEGRAVMVDLDSVRSVLFVSMRRRIRNLERLYRDFAGTPGVTRTLCFRFLLDYCGSRSVARQMFLRVAERWELKRVK